MVKNQNRPNPEFFTIFVPMKSLSFILSIYVFSLFIVPVLATPDMSAKPLCCQDFCSAENEERPDNNRKDSRNETCNLYLSCQCCYGFTLPKAISLPEPFSFLITDKNQYRQSLSLQYFTSIWRPPKA